MIELTIDYNVTYRVVSFYDNNGNACGRVGIDKLERLSDALVELDRFKNADPSVQWIIAVDVTKVARPNV